MARKANRRYTPEFKAEVALQALGKEYTQVELAAKYGVQQPHISMWVRQLKKRAYELFAPGNGKKPGHKTQSVAGEDSGLVDELYQKIGKKEIELDRYRKSGGSYRSPEL